MDYGQKFLLDLVNVWLLLASEFVDESINVLFILVSFKGVRSLNLLWYRNVSKTIFNYNLVLDYWEGWLNQIDGDRLLRVPVFSLLVLLTLNRRDRGECLHLWLHNLIDLPFLCLASQLPSKQLKLCLHCWHVVHLADNRGIQIA